MNNNLFNILLTIFVTQTTIQELQLLPIREICTESSEFEQQYSEYLNNKTVKQFLQKQQLLGQGSFGKVYKANFIGRKIAIKDIHYEKNVRIAPQLLQIEINLLKALENSNHFAKMYFCVYLELNDELDHVYVFSQRLYLDIDTVRTQFLTKFNSIQRIEKYKEIAMGLKQLHDLGYIQSDLKPENIIASDPKFQFLKIIDLGLATKIGDPLVGGTDYYYGALQSEKQPIATTKFDIFSLGMTIITIERGDELQYDYENDDQYQKNVKLILKDFKKNTDLKFKDQNNIGFFRRIINFFKRLFGIEVNVKFSDYIEKMVSWNEDQRPTIDEVIKNFETWEFEDIDFYNQQHKDLDSNDSDEDYRNQYLTKFDENGAKFIVL